MEEATAKIKDAGFPEIELFGDIACRTEIKQHSRFQAAVLFCSNPVAGGKPSRILRCHIRLRRENTPHSMRFSTVLFKRLSEYPKTP